MCVEGMCSDTIIRTISSLWCSTELSISPFQHFYCEQILVPRWNIYILSMLLREDIIQIAAMNSMRQHFGEETISQYTIQTGKLLLLSNHNGRAE